MTSNQAWRRGAGLALTGCVLVACSGGSPHAAAPTTVVAPPTTAAAPPTTCTLPGAAPTVAAGVADPYLAAGARQRPGPGMVQAAPPARPVTVAVARPPDPDAGAAARQPDGVALTTTTTNTPPPTAAIVTEAPPATNPGDCGSAGDGNEDP